jgi:predicted Rossmann fold nucleotide-binding protein DprA/Smf involved in DNA uptake
MDRSWDAFMARVTKKSTHRLAVVGSRHCTDQDLVEIYILMLHEQLGERLSLVSGAAKGVDTLARISADKYGIPIKEFPADWNKYGRAAGPIRNKQLVQSSDAVLAFVAPTSKGTRNTISLAQERGLPVHVVNLPA